MSIKVNLSGYSVIFSESFIITHESNSLSLEGGAEFGNFKLRLIFEKKVSKHGDGEIVARIESEVKDGLNLRMYNFFNVEESSNAKGLTRFFRQKIKDEQEQEIGMLGYYFSFSSQSLSDKHDAILFNLNIATKVEVDSKDSED